MEGDWAGKDKQDKARDWGKLWPIGRGLVYETISGNAEASLAGLSPAATGTSYLSSKGKIMECENPGFPHTLDPRELPSS